MSDLEEGEIEEVPGMCRSVYLKPLQMVGECKEVDDVGRKVNLTEKEEGEITPEEDGEERGKMRSLIKSKVRSVRQVSLCTEWWDKYGKYCRGSSCVCGIWRR